MRILDEKLSTYLDWPDLIDALRRQFKAGCVVPDRHHHTIQTPGQSDATILLMPAWQPGDRIGVKLANVFPDNTQHGMPSITADYLLYDGKTGRGLATMNGSIITARRTAAAAALGADFLSRPDSRTLFMVGAGRVAAMVPGALRAIRPIQRVMVWDIRVENAKDLCNRLRESGFDANPELDLRRGTEVADIISCATLSTNPLIEGAWLRSGQHLDLIGSFTPGMRETDDHAMGSSEIYIDTETALTECGDLIGPLASGVITRDAVRGTLTSLCRGQVPGRASPESKTLFKAVGTALEDLAAASLAYDRHLAETGCE